MYGNVYILNINNAEAAILRICVLFGKRIYLFIVTILLCTKSSALFCSNFGYELKDGKMFLAKISQISIHFSELFDEEITINVNSFFGHNEKYFEIRINRLVYLNSN